MKVDSLAICVLSVIPVRAAADDRSEIVTQLLFGEEVRILEVYKQWLRIEITHDGYQGWVDRKQLIEVTPSDSSKLETNRIVAPSLLKTPWGETTVLQGSPSLSTAPNFKLGTHSYKWLAPVLLNENNDVTALSLGYLNAPYLWGGRTKYGIDCSGLTQTIFHQMGYQLQRDASQQVLQGVETNLENSKPGDLAFFISEKSGKITHVGIILADSKIIHAHGRVRIDTLNAEGIYNEEEKYYSHKLSNIKSYTIKN